LASRARARFGGTAVFVGGAGDAALSAAPRARLTGPALDLAGKTTPPRPAALLGRADLVVAHDPGALDLAAALGGPVAAPYTCTRVGLTGPYGATGAVATRVRCAGSLRKTCGRMDCLAELTPERLWPVVSEVLARWQSERVTA